MNVICWNKLGVSPANICCLTNSTWTQATVSGPSRAWWTGEWPAKFKKIHGTNRKTVGKYFGIYHGWWFQTWILLSISYIVCHPSHWLIFFRGVKTTSQMVLVYHGSIMFESLATGLSCLYAFKHLRYDPFADWDATGCAWKWEDCPLYLGVPPMFRQNQCEQCSKTLLVADWGLYMVVLSNTLDILGSIIIDELRFPFLTSKDFEWHSGFWTGLVVILYCYHGSTTNFWRDYHCY